MADARLVRVTRWSPALLGLVVLLAGAALPALHGFDGLYGQDAFGYAGYALGPLRDALAAGQGPPTFFWPPGYPVLVLLADGLAGWGDASGRLVSLVAGALLPVLVVGLARELLPGSPPAVPLLAGVLTAVAGHLWQSSVVGMSDTAGVAAATAGAWAACRYARTGRLGWLALAAGVTAYAIATRWAYGLVAPAIALVALVALARGARTRPRRAVLHATVASLIVGAVALPVAGPMLVAAVAGAPIPFAGDFGAYRWDALGAFRSSAVTIDGVLSYELPAGAFYLLQPVQPYWLGPLGLLAIPGVAATLRAPTVARASLLLAWPALVLGFHAGGGYQNTRFFLAALPPVAILAAFGAGVAWVAAARLGTRAWAAQRLLAVAIAIAVAASAVVAVRFTDAFIDRHARDLAAIRSLASRVPGDARLLTIGATPVLTHDGAAEVVELYWLDAPAALDLVGDGRPTFVLVDRRAIDGQWHDENPGRAVAALEAGPGLELLETEGIWTLYRVGPSPDRTPQ